MILYAYSSDEEKALYKVVRSFDLMDVPGDIIAANEDTGECTMAVDGEKVEHTFGPKGLILVKRARR